MYLTLSNWDGEGEPPERIEFGVGTYDPKDMATLTMTRELWEANGKPRSIKLPLVLV